MSLPATAYVARHFSPVTDPALYRCPCVACAASGYATPEPADLLLRRLDSMRTILGRAIVVTSGPRCLAHDAELSHSAQRRTGTPGAHVRGWAADLAAPSGADRFALVNSAMTAGFQRVVLYHDQAIVHVDIGRDGDFPSPDLVVL